MKLLRLILPVLLLTLTFLAPATAQDTRGSLVPDTLVTLADGTTIAVQDLAIDASILTFDAGGKPLAGKVTGIRRQHADSYILLKAGPFEVQATGSHRVALAGYKLVRLDAVKVGDKVMVTGPKGLEEAAATSVREYPANLIAYDLTVEGHRLFTAGGVVLGD